MKYYYREHISGYQKMKINRMKSWGELHGNPDGFENFSSRSFLDNILPQLHFSSIQPTVLEYGCGTGPGAFYLAKKGFKVHGIDLIPTAIEVARQLALELGLDIQFEVQDICNLSHEGKKYDMIVDSYCLQGIITDEDRKRIFSGVRARLKSNGYYLISSAMYDEDRHHLEDKIIDRNTGKIYSRYDEDALFDIESEVYYDTFFQDLDRKDKPTDYDGTIEINGTWYIITRRYRKPETLKTELEGQGFKVLFQSGSWGENLVCVLAGNNISNNII